MPLGKFNFVVGQIHAALKASYNSEILMIDIKFKNSRTSYTVFAIFTVGFLAFFTANCSAQPAVSADLALRNLRAITKSGGLPAESVVADIESRFSGRTTGVLARLMRARIKFEENDYAGAAQILDTDLFERRSKVGDYALWLRGKSLIEAGQHAEAQKALSAFVTKYPDSLRSKQVRLLLAESLISTGNARKVVEVLGPLNKGYDGDSLLLTARAYESMGENVEAVKFLQAAYFRAATSGAANLAESKLKEMQQDLQPRNAEDILARANALYIANKYADALSAFDQYSAMAGDSSTMIQLKRLRSAAGARLMPVAQSAFDRIPISSEEKTQAFNSLATGYARSGDWKSAGSVVNRMRSLFPKSQWTPKTLVELGNIAGNQKRTTDKNFYLRTALAAYPDALDVAEAQFEYAWNQHELKNFEISSTLLTEHLARYVDKDNSYRGQSGYWAARDSEKSGKIDEACALYDGTVYRYGANWYGYQALQRLSTLRRQGKCQTPGNFPAKSLIPKAVENLKIVTVASETATSSELEHAAKSEQLSMVGLFDWAIDELREAKKTAGDSPKINLTLAKHYRLKGDFVSALLALKPSYPDYPQMFPEEMGREEWEIFYPLNHWNEIKYWSGKRSLDPYHVAGLIRQETIFDPDARSRANAYGLMQLLVPTARSMARKYNSSIQQISGQDLFNPPLNIELGTAYMREQLSKYGSIEYMSVAYNAGPGRVVSWRRTLPLQMDEFVEEIPFSETRGYVKGVIRNSSQYRRLYDFSGEFKPNVGARPLKAQLESMPEDKFKALNPGILLVKKRKFAK